MSQVIGLSLSFCVQDIVRGKINLSEIEKVISGTNVQNGSWEELISQYKLGYWQENPEKAEKVFRELLQGGKIEQPRLKGEDPPNIALGHWLVNGVRSRKPS